MFPPVTAGEVRAMAGNESGGGRALIFWQARESDLGPIQTHSEEPVDWILTATRPGIWMIETLPAVSEQE
jgi:hypothetical protein